ncbi:unnamed protein product [Lota lota]
MSSCANVHPKPSASPFSYGPSFKMSSVSLPISLAPAGGDTACQRDGFNLLLLFVLLAYRTVHVGVFFFSDYTITLHFYFHSDPEMRREQMMLPKMVSLVPLSSDPL